MLKICVFEAMTKPKLLFLNPPGKKVYLRDYFCSKVSQADYINHPIDFVCLSGWLKGDYDLSLVDAIVERLSSDACLTKIEHLQPEVIVGLIGSVSYPEDIAFYRRLSEKIRSRLILIGDILIDSRAERLQELSFADALLHDFGGEDLLNYLDGATGKNPTLINLTIRKNGSIHECPIARPRGETWELPIPRHELFMNMGYRYPFVRKKKFATILTEFGCPYLCTFCIMSTLGWKIRSVHNVMAELKFLHALGVRELFFLDQTFGIQKGRACELLEEMANYNEKFGWVCFSRPDIVDDYLLALMKRAGCHTIILGLESGSDNILKWVKKGYDKQAVGRGFQLCRKHGIRTVATILIGLPEETEVTFADTLKFLREVDPDFASFNVAVPRMDTPLRDNALELGLIDSEFEVMDQSGGSVAMPSLTLTRQQIAAMKRQAIKEFYLNSNYVGARLKQLTLGHTDAWSDLRIQMRQGLSLLRNYFST
jgi:radical SAM superfamily enzyme YgiQ (UPF0313 family)